MTDIDFEQSYDFNPHAPVMDSNAAMNDDALNREVASIQKNERIVTSADVCQHLADAIMGFDISPAMCKQILSRLDIQPSATILDLYQEAADRFGFGAA